MNLIPRHPVVMGLIIMVSAALGAGVNHWLIGGTSAGQDASQNASKRLSQGSVAPESRPPCTGWRPWIPIIGATNRVARRWVWRWCRFTKMP